MLFLVEIIALEILRVKPRIMCYNRTISCCFDDVKIHPIASIYFSSSNYTLNEHKTALVRVLWLDWKIYNVDLIGIPSDEFFPFHLQQKQCWHLFNWEYKQFGVIKQSIEFLHQRLTVLIDCHPPWMNRCWEWHTPDGATTNPTF